MHTFQKQSKKKRSTFQIRQNSGKIHYETRERTPTKYRQFEQDDSYKLGKIHCDQNDSSSGIHTGGGVTVETCENQRRQPMWTTISLKCGSP